MLTRLWRISMRGKLPRACKWRFRDRAKAVCSTWGPWSRWSLSYRESVHTHYLKTLQKINTHSWVVNHFLCLHSYHRIWSSMIINKLKHSTRGFGRQYLPLLPILSSSSSKWSTFSRVSLYLPIGKYHSYIPEARSQCSILVIES